MRTRLTVMTLLSLLVSIFLVTGSVSCTNKVERGKTEKPKDRGKIELQKIKVSEAVRGFFFVPLYVAHGKEFFKEEGLDVEIVSASGGPAAMQALVSGEVQFTATGHGQVANLFLEGKKTKIINQMQNRCTFSMLGRPEIRSLNDLKGKKIGVTKIGAETYGVGRFLAARAGLEPEKDVQMIGVGGMDTMASALENNSVQAIMAWEPLTTKLLNENKAVLLAKLNTQLDSRKHFGSPYYSFSVIEVTDEYLSKHPAVVQKFVNAMVKAEDWIQKHGEDELAEVVSPYFSGVDKGTIVQSLENDTQAFSTDGLVAKESHETAVKVFTEAGILKEPVAFDDIVDNSFTTKALSRVR